jgi:hypothetical protein
MGLLGGNDTRVNRPPVLRHGDDSGSLDHTVDGKSAVQGSVPIPAPPAIHLCLSRPLHLARLLRRPKSPCQEIRDSTVHLQQIPAIKLQCGPGDSRITLRQAISVFRSKLGQRQIVGFGSGNTTLGLRNQRYLYLKTTIIDW